VNADGEVIGTDSSLVIPDAAEARYESICTTSGKLLGGSHVAQPTRSVTVNQVNIGATDALEAAKRVSFLLAAARAKQPTAPMLDATAQASTEAGAKPSP
jgi:hypothetical protein